LASAQAAAASASQKLALSQEAVLGAASSTAAAQTTLARSTAASVAAQTALNKAVLTTDVGIKNQAVDTLALARAQEVEAATALAATRAQAAHAASLGNVSKAAVASGAGFLGLRGAVLTAGTGFIAATVAFQALSRSIGLAAQLETELNVFRVTAGATADQMERVSEAATALGRDITLPGVNAQDAAETMSQLARAGLDVEDAMAAARGTLQLATAAEIENAQATELVANALNSFKLEGTDATRVADLFAGAAKESQGSIVDMGLALKQASAIASGLGISIEDTVTLLTQLSRAGLSSSDAGTSLRQTFLRLIQNLPKVNDEVEKLGLNLRDASGNIRPEIFEELGTKLRKLTPAARQTAIANLGGADAIRTYLLLSREAVGTFDQVQASITQQGLASEAAAARTSGLAGDVEAAKNELTTLGTTAGRVASGPLSFLARTAGLAAGAINDMNREIEESNAPRELARGLGDLFNIFEKVNLSFRQGATGATNFGSELHALDGIAGAVTEKFEGMAQSLREARDAFTDTQGTPDEGLGVQQVLNRVSGFDSAETRAKIRGSTDELLSVLQAEQDFLRAQLERQFVQNRPALRDQLQQALLGSIQEAEGIAKAGAAEAKRATAEAARAAKEAAAELARAIAAADQELLSTLGNRREDAERRAGAAEATEGVADDIKAQNRIQALIKQQIQKVRDRIKDEQTRKGAIRELRIAIIASRQEEERLREEQKKAAAEQRVTAILERGASLELDIELADINENDKRRVALRRRRIAQLKREAKLLKLEGNALKENRNERARIRKEIEDILKEEGGGDGGRSAQQFFFEQLQAQQGFASNLMGNLITGPTAGLVGVPSPTTQPGSGIQAAANAAQGKAGGGPSAGQANTTNALLERILEQLKRANSSNSAPEATHQRRVGAAAMDGSGNIHGIQG
jgi:TP901 family phage tail tape measure protein